MDGHNISFRQAVRVWAKIGLNSFGGPAGQIAVMHRILVEELRWIGEARFLHALNYCMLLPGPEAQQLATYIGWLMHGTAGGLAAGLLFVLPGFLSILVLSLLYAGFHDAAVVASLLYGMKAAVLAVVVEAVIRIGKRVAGNRKKLALSAAAFAALFLWGAPFPAVIVVAGMIGWTSAHFWPKVFQTNVTPPAAGQGDQAAADAILDEDASPHLRPSVRRARGVLAVCLTLWFLPIVVLHLWLGSEHVFTREAVFFSKAAVVTFGGAYSVLTYIAQQAVEVHGWLSPAQMLDGLGMAETTPGPLIQVVQFVGFLGAYHQPGDLSPWLAGVLASVLVTWVTYVPCFLWIFLGAPYMESVRRHPGLNGALSAITAAVLGVVINLAVWFGLHVLFADVEAVAGPMGMRLLRPQWATLDIASLTITACAGIALVRYRVSVVRVLLAAMAAGAVWRVLLTGAG